MQLQYLIRRTYEQTISQNEPLSHRQKLIDIQSRNSTLNVSKLISKRVQDYSRYQQQKQTSNSFILQAEQTQRQQDNKLNVSRVKQILPMIQLNKSAINLTQIRSNILNSRITQINLRNKSLQARIDDIKPVIIKQKQLEGFERHSSMKKMLQKVPQVEPHLKQFCLLRLKLKHLEIKNENLHTVNQMVFNLQLNSYSRILGKSGYFTQGQVSEEPDFLFKIPRKKEQMMYLALYESNICIGQCQIILNFDKVSLGVVLERELHSPEQSSSITNEVVAEVMIGLKIA